MKLIDKINKNNKINKFKEIWHNKRYHGLIVLGLWFIFFTIIIISLKIKMENINNNKPIKIQEKTINEILSNINNYSFTYQIEKNDEIIYINGTNYNDEYSITLNEFNYYIKDNYYLKKNETFKKTDNPLDFNIREINIKNIYNLIKTEEPLYIKDENNIKISVYKILLSEYIEISISQENNEIKKINLDLTQYMNHDDLLYKKYNLEITIDDINDIGRYNYEVE